MLLSPLATKDKGLGSQLYHEEVGGRPWRQLPQHYHGGKIASKLKPKVGLHLEKSMSH